jgi:cysteinyl-tRNA synthetase
LSVVWDVLRSDLSDSEKAETIFDMDKVLGLDLKKTVATLQSSSENELPEEVIELLDEREEARNQKDWARSDELRNKIHDLGFEVKDSSDGQEVVKVTE